MATHDIPHSDWETFFRNFSERRRGATVTVEVADPQKGLHKEEANVTLDAITLTDGNTIAVGFANGTSHVVTSPKSVYHKTAAGVMSDEVNHDEIIEITSADSPPVTQFHFGA